MPRRNDSSWAQQVPNRTWRGPYDDYGWERDESGLPEFRDPDVHLSREERRQVQRWRKQNQQRIQNSSYQEWNVPGPHTGHGPKGYQRSDERIMEDICDRLTQHGQIDASDINVQVDKGEVTLQGTVPDRRMKRTAEDVAESVSGVWDVNNQLHLSRSQQRGMPSTGGSQGSNQRNSGMPGGGQGRTDEVGGSGVYPASGPLPDENAPAQGMASWGQGERGAAGYEDHGNSELDLGPEENQ